MAWLMCAIGVCTPLPKAAREVELKSMAKQGWEAIVYWLSKVQHNLQDGNSSTWCSFSLCAQRLIVLRAMLQV